MIARHNLLIGVLSWSISLAWATEHAFSSSAILEPVKDSSIFSDELNNSNGLGISLFAGRTGGDESRRALIAFDIAAVVPAGARIEEAELTLTSFRNSRSDASADDVFTLHAITTDWGEASAPGSDSGPLGGGGTSAADGDATWLSSFHDGASWSTPGGDFVSSASAQQTVGLVTAPDSLPVTWSGIGLVADVQNWLDNPASNFGWVVIGDSNNGERTARLFGSRERSEGTPKLAIQYSVVPEPSSLALIAMLFMPTQWISRCCSEKQHSGSQL